MKQKSPSKLSLKKTTVSKLDNDQLNRVQGGTEAIVSAFVAAFLLFGYEMGKGDGAKNKTK